MNLVRCQKCGTVVLTNNTLEERLITEREELEKEIEKKGPRAHRQTLIQRIHEINRLLKQMRHQARKEQIDVYEVFSSLLVDELAKCGYKNPWFQELKSKAEETRQKELSQANRQLKTLYGDAGKILDNNEWRNSSGNYDPTAKRAIDKANKKA